MFNYIAANAWLLNIFLLFLKKWLENRKRLYNIGT